MYNSVLSMPARRSAAAIGTAVALAAGTLALAPSSQAATASGSGGGQATATVLRANVNASVLNNNVSVPVVLDDVHAPADAHENTLNAKVQVPLNNQKFTVLTADVATADATTNQSKAEGSTHLANAKVELPGLPEPVLQAKVLSARATCVVGQQPTAKPSIVDLVVLGKAQEVKLGQTITVPVKGVGQVTIELSTKNTTSNTAAATALALHADLNPAEAGIAKVHADVVLARATCQTPSGSGATGGGSTSGATGGGSTSGATGGGSTSGATGGGATSGSTSGATGGGSTSGASQGASSGASTAGSQTAGAGKNLAETGASSSTPYIAGGAAALLVAGGAAVYVTRRRKSSAAQG